MEERKKDVLRALIASVEKLNEDSREKLLIYAEGMAMQADISRKKEAEKATA